MESKWNAIYEVREQHDSIAVREPRTHPEFARDSKRDERVREKMRQKSRRHVKVRPLNVNASSQARYAYITPSYHTKGEGSIDELPSIPHLHTTTDVRDIM